MTQIHSERRSARQAKQSAVHKRHLTQNVMSDTKQNKSHKTSPELTCQAKLHAVRQQQQQQLQCGTMAHLMQDGGTDGTNPGQT